MSSAIGRAGGQPACPVVHLLNSETAGELNCLEGAFHRTYCESDGQPCKLPFPIGDYASLITTFGWTSLCGGQLTEVRDFMGEMIAPDRASRLWDLIEQCKGKQPTEVGFVAGNAMTLLAAIRNAALDGRDLSRLVLPGISIRGRNCGQSNFSDSVLDDSEFIRTDLSKSLFTKTSLRGSRWSSPGLQDTAFDTADFSDVELEFNDYTYGLSFSPDGSLIASCGDTREISIWHIETGRCIAQLFMKKSPIQGLSFSPSGEFIAAGDFGGVIRVWNVRSGNLLWESKRHKDAIRDLKYDSSGERILTAGDDNKIVVSQAFDGATICSLKTMKKPMSVAITADDQFVASCSSNTGEVIVWSLPDNALVRKWKAYKHTARSATFSKQSNQLITTGFDFTGPSESRQASMYVWDVPSCTKIRTIQFIENGGLFHGSTSPVARLFAGRDENQAAVWDFESGQKTATLVGDRDWLIATAFSNDGMSLAASGTEGIIRIWDLATNSLKKLIVQIRYCEGMILKNPQGLSKHNLALLRERGAQI